MKVVIKQRAEMIRKGVVPEGYKQTKVGIIPQEWEVKKLKKLFEAVTHKNKDGEENKVLTASGKYGLVLQDTFFNKSVAGKDLNGYYILKKGEYAYNRSSMKGYPFGAIKRQDRYHQALVSTLYICFKSASDCFETDYYKYFFDSDLPNFQLSKITQVGARAHGLLNVGKNDFMSIKIPFPHLPEQTNISEILSTADKAIETTETLITLKQQKKKWLMQNLLTGKARLPKYDNCPVPVQERIRMINEGIVPEGYKKTKVGIIPVEWDVKRIGKVKGIDLDPESLNNKTSNNYTFNYISLSDVAEGELLNKTRICFQNAPSRARKIVKKNDVLLSTVRPNLKSHLYIDWQESDLVCSTGFTVLRFDEKIINSLFIFLNCFSDNVDKQINSYLVGSNYPAITKKDVSALKIPIPFLTEQTAIANVLSTADKEIDLLNQKLETLKQQKKALMQLLLTGIVRTTGLKTN